MPRIYHDTERVAQGGWKRTYQVTCFQCGKDFEANRYDASFCSSTCRSRYSREAAKRKARRDDAIDLVQQLVSSAQLDRTGADSATLVKIERLCRDALLELSQQRALPLVV